MFLFSWHCLCFSPLFFVVEGGLAGTVEWANPVSLSSPLSPTPYTCLVSTCQQFPFSTSRSWKKRIFTCPQTKKQGFRIYCPIGQECCLGAKRISKIQIQLQIDIQREERREQHVTGDTPRRSRSRRGCRPQNGGRPGAAWSLGQGRWCPPALRPERTC